MRIAVNASIMDGHPTGMGWYTVNMVNAMLRLDESRRHEFTIFTSEGSLFQLRENARINKLPRYVRTHDFHKLGAGLRFLWNQSFYTYTARQFDLCYSPTHHCSLFFPQIITIHDLIGLNFPDQHRLQYYYYRTFLPAAVRKAKRIITVSESTKADIVKFMKCPPEKVRVIPNGYNEGLYYRRTEAADQVRSRYGLEEYLLTIGATYPHKNLERLIESYAMLPSHLKDRYKLVIVGSMNTYVRHLQTFARERGVAEHLLFAGYVRAEELPILYSGALAMIYPSLYEGFGLPPIEAMACGCPVILSHSTSLPEVGGDAAYYVDPYDTDSITRAMEEVSTRPRLRECLIERGYERSSRFSWDVSAGQLLSALDAESP